MAQTVKYEIRDKQVYKVIEEKIDTTKPSQEAMDALTYLASQERKGGRPKQPKDKK